MALTGLVVDWGGVLTGSLELSTGAWAEAEDVDLDSFREVLRTWLGGDVAAAAEQNPLYALERGEVAVPDFERRLAERLRSRSGAPLRAEGLLARMFDHFVHAPEMAALVLRARRSGLRTALLSNSWGNDYPRDGWDDMFDEVVISGEVGMRKPEARIYAHVLDRLRLPAGECVFVDDLRANVAAAVAVGMVGVVHETYEATAAELEVLFERPLAR
ncbi:HAD-IA family hydrolase [Vallicoccus soli]|uniref:HAD-IA family hydrolase n=1 Tax=Vallicoccus soli TaxID=2339232 RepID=UPI001C49B3F9|nr:HAD-IA family hydrolase [Vallicoccus soli]